MEQFDGAYDYDYDDDDFDDDDGLLRAALVIGGLSRKTPLGLCCQYKMHFLMIFGDEC